MAETEKKADFRRFRRVELLELLVEMGKENDRLAEELRLAQETIAKRALKIENVGSMAEAALALNDVFAAADAACAQYMESIQAPDGKHSLEAKTPTDPLIIDAQSEAQRILSQAENKAEEILRNARMQAREELDSARKDAELMLSEAESILDELDAERRKRRMLK